jgi:transcriptional regulator
MPESLELLKGTLDVLILKTLSWEPLHGYGISKALRSATADTFQVEEGALYPALRRLEKRGLLEAEWGTTETGREARFYRLTPAGRASLERDVRAWSRYVEAMARVLFADGPRGDEVGR